MTTWIERAASLVVGTVESVAADEIHVTIDTDAPQAVALTGC